MTEAASPPDPNDITMVDENGVHENGDRVNVAAIENGQSNDSIQNNNQSNDRRDDRDDQTEPNRLDCNTNDHVPIAGRVRTRRATMVSGAISEISRSPILTRKRRMSIAESGSNKVVGSRTRSQAAADPEPIMTKRMRINSISPNKNQMNSRNQSPIKAQTSSEKGQSLPVTPQQNCNTSNQILYKKLRAKKLKIETTPRITQYFSQKPQLKCNRCIAMLNSQNELNFHLKSHANGRCAKCHIKIDNDKPASVNDHMISCLYLGNRLSKDLLTRFLKVKVDIKRLTPTKIAQIQKRLIDEAKQGNVMTERQQREAQKIHSNDMNDTETMEHAPSNDDSKDGKIEREKKTFKIFQFEKKNIATKKKQTKS